MDENTLFPGRDNYTGPDSGALGLCHHNYLFEPSHSFAERVEAIRNTKPKNEIATRLHNLIYLDFAMIPGISQEAGARLEEAAARWQEADARWQEAAARLEEADARLAAALALRSLAADAAKRAVWYQLHGNSLSMDRRSVPKLLMDAADKLESRALGAPWEFESILDSVVDYAGIDRSQYADSPSDP